MSFFERGDDANNLGKKPLFRDVEDFADPDAKTVQDLVDERAEARERFLKEGDKSVFNKDDFDFTPSVWEDDVEEGKYDPKPEDYELKVVSEPTITSSFKTQDRVTRNDAIERLGQARRGYSLSDGHLPKRQKEKPSRDSIRFDEVA